MNWRRVVASIFMIFLAGCSLNPNLVKTEPSHVVCKVTFIQMGENTRLIYEFDGFTVSFTRINDGATRIVTTVKESGGEERDIDEFFKMTRTEADVAKSIKIYELKDNCNKAIEYF